MEFLPPEGSPLLLKSILCYMQVSLVSHLEHVVQVYKAAVVPALGRLMNTCDGQHKDLPIKAAK